MNERIYCCAKCGSSDIRRSRIQGVAELPRMLIGIYPFRCMACGERFFGNVLRLAMSSYATCPRCLRWNVQPLPKRERHVSAWGRLREALGAVTYRCPVCRITFVSFRKQLHPSAQVKPPEVPGSSLSSAVSHGNGH